MSNSRNRIINNGLILEKVIDYSIVSGFDCGDEDLNEYYNNDVQEHKNQLLTKTYAFYHLSEPTAPLALVDLCNDSVRREKIMPFHLFPEKKRYPDYPAVKITRLGVASHIHSDGIGSYLILAVKRLFLQDNRTGCRLITVDAYNNPRTLTFYLKNEFRFFNEKDVNKNTRHMFFDLLSVRKIED